MTDLPFQFHGAILGIDHGIKYIGLALSRTGYFADPLLVLARKSRAEDFARIKALIAEHDIRQIVLGMPPKPPDFVGHAQADTVRIWAGRLAEAVNLPIYLTDEGLSTVDAELALDDAGTSAPERVDAHAAAMILQRCLDAVRETGQAPPLFMPD